MVGITVYLTHYSLCIFWQIPNCILNLTIASLSIDRQGFLVGNFNPIPFLVTTDIFLIFHHGYYKQFALKRIDPRKIANVIQGLVASKATVLIFHLLS